MLWLIFRFILMLGCFTIAGYISYGIVMYGFAYVKDAMTDAKLAKHFLIIVEVGLISIWYINKVTTSTKIKNTFSFHIKKLKVTLPTASTIVYYFLISALFITSVIPATLGVEQNRKEKIHWYPDEVDPINTVMYENLIIKNKELIEAKEREIEDKKKEMRSATDEKVYSRAYWSKYRKEKEIQEAQNNIKDYNKDIEEEVERFKTEKTEYKEKLNLYKEQRKNYFTFIIKNFWESIVIILLQLFNLYTSSKGSALLENIIEDIKKLTNKRKKKKKDKIQDKDSSFDKVTIEGKDYIVEKKSGIKIPVKADFNFTNLEDIKTIAGRPTTQKVQQEKSIESDNSNMDSQQVDISEQKSAENDLVVPKDSDDEDIEPKVIETAEETHDSLNLKVKDTLNTITNNDNKTYLGEVKVEDGYNGNTEDNTQVEEKETILTERELMDDSIPIRPPKYTQRRKVQNPQN